MLTRAFVAATAVALLVAGCGSTRSDDVSAPSASPPSSSPSAASPSAVGTTSAAPSSTPPAETTTSAAPSATAEEAITAKSSKEFAALLRVGDYCDPSVGAFADTYAGRTVEFAGSIAALTNHEDYTSRYDILVAPGDEGSSSVRGPAFQFQDVNMLDLNLIGTDVPDSLGADDKLYIVATVDGYDPDQCLFFLDPVSTKVR